MLVVNIYLHAKVILAKYFEVTKPLTFRYDYKNFANSEWILADKIVNGKYVFRQFA